MKNLLNLILILDIDQNYGSSLNFRWLRILILDPCISKGQDSSKPKRVP